ncbi:MAG: sialidase family protein, partial [Terracidiphilus sp.]
IRSTDQGRSWEEYGIVAAIQPNEAPWPWMGKEGPNEATLVRLSKDRLYCLFRTGGGDYMGEAWSMDDGKTWTAPVSSGFKGVAPHLRLMSDGLLACTYGRPGPVTIMFSSDEGKTWTNVTPISHGMSTQYTDLIEVEPGKLLVVYDRTPYGWKAIPSSDKSSKNAIYGTFVEVRRR